ncbi:CsgE family curli-type amyloid fiber assembly protein [Flavobacterium sp. PL002]|uniref:CsgE family curli-type amyloid fiber assembly protein n=1 Tax=unclassified Flavobacterium TaxID=196869 RepID=UPI00351C1BA6
MDGFELRGIVSDETKTRMGKDFYDLYYYLYNEYRINSKEIVAVNEEFSFSRNTKIMISINNELVYEFLSRPDEDYLDTMAKKAIYETYLHLKDLEKKSEYFTQY